MYNHKDKIEGFSSFYWSSIERNNTTAWYQNFDDGSRYASNKNNNNYVRCIRK